MKGLPLVFKYIIYFVITGIVVLISDVIFQSERSSAIHVMIIAYIALWCDVNDEYRSHP